MAVIYNSIVQCTRCGETFIHLGPRPLSKPKVRQLAEAQCWTCAHARGEGDWCPPCYEVLCSEANAKAGAYH